MSIDLPPEPPAIIINQQKEGNKIMSIGPAPKWLDSPYVYQDENGKYLLKEDAPEDIKKEYEEYWKEEKEN